MVEQKEKSLEQRAQMSPETFTNIVRTNIADVLFDPKEEQTGNIKRLTDLVLDNFNPLDPSTWRNEKARVRRYQIVLNPDLDEETKLLGFLRQVNNVRIDLENGNNKKNTSFNEISNLYEKERMQQEEAIQNFYRENQELIKEVFKDII